jgi:hypothetical protein
LVFGKWLVSNSFLLQAKLSAHFPKFRFHFWLNYQVALLKNNSTFSLRFAISILLWAVIFALSAHPSVTWGDGLGYVMAAESGFDWGTNANSHFLYLNFAHLLSILFPGIWLGNLMTGLSLVSSLLVLALTYEIGKKWKNDATGLWALHILGSCFTFWRHACTIEVYAFELVFWALCFWFLLQFFQNKKWHWFAFFTLYHAIGLLVHIHLILIFPVYLLLFLKKIRFPVLGLASYLLPVLVVFVSVNYMKTNTLNQVFFDAIQDKMLDISVLGVLKGSLFILVLLGILSPGIWILLLGVFLSKKLNLRLWIGDLFLQTMLLVLIVVLGFASLYPDPGIHVFLLPGFLVLAFAVGNLAASFFSNKWYSMVYPVFQVLLFYGFFRMYEWMHPVPNTALELKGGPGYLFLPWARGNISSVLEVAEKLAPTEFPPSLKWNLDMARQYQKKEK